LLSLLDEEIGLGRHEVVGQLGHEADRLLPHISGQPWPDLRRQDRLLGQGRLERHWHTSRGIRSSE